nr:hypothetical protein CFP56_64900 [Quercus suber]
MAGRSMPKDRQQCSVVHRSLFVPDQTSDSIMARNHNGVQAMGLVHLMGKSTAMACDRLGKPCRSSPALSPRLNQSPTTCNLRSSAGRNGRAGWQAQNGGQTSFGPIATGCKHYISGYCHFPSLLANVIFQERVFSQHERACRISPSERSVGTTPVHVFVSCSHNVMVKTRHTTLPITAKLIKGLSAPLLTDPVGMGGFTEGGPVLWCVDVMLVMVLLESAVVEVVLT